MKIILKNRHFKFFPLKKKKGKEMLKLYYNTFQVNKEKYAYTLIIHIVMLK